MPSAPQILGFCLLIFVISDEERKIRRDNTRDGVSHAIRFALIRRAVSQR